MAALTDAQTIAYLKRSYQAVDGLWFVCTEDAFDFDTALNLDEKVWEIFAKIQARKLKELLKLDPKTNPELNPLAALHECLVQKMLLDDFDFTVETHPEEIVITVNRCPWLKLIQDSGRGHLAEKIGQRICPAEYGMWAREFGSDISFELPCRACRGDDCCSFRYRRAACDSTE